MAVRQTQQTTVESIQNEIEAVRAEIDAVEQLKDEVQSADRIGNTRLSGLFHEARTSKTGVWRRATAFCTIEDGEVVVQQVNKLAEGRWSPETREQYDLCITIPIVPFMGRSVFKRQAGNELRDAISTRKIKHGQLDIKIQAHEAGPSEGWS